MRAMNMAANPYLEYMSQEVKVPPQKKKGKPSRKANGGTVAPVPPKVKKKLPTTAKPQSEIQYEPFRSFCLKESEGIMVLDADIRSAF
jgi:hypothetical protein